MIRPAGRSCCIPGCMLLPAIGAFGSAPVRRIGLAPRAKTSVASVTSSRTRSPGGASPAGRDGGASRSLDARDRRCAGSWHDRKDADAAFCPRRGGGAAPAAGTPPFFSARDPLRRVGADCAIEVDGNAYSVPWRLIGERVRVTVGGGVGALAGYMHYSDQRPSSQPYPAEARSTGHVLAEAIF